MLVVIARWTAQPGSPGKTTPRPVPFPCTPCGAPLLFGQFIVGQHLCAQFIPGSRSIYSWPQIFPFPILPSCVITLFPFQFIPITPEEPAGAHFDLYSLPAVDSPSLTPAWEPTDDQPCLVVDPNPSYRTPPSPSHCVCSCGGTLTFPRRDPQDI